MDLPLSVSEAALGTEVTVPTPGGAKVRLKVPAGTQSGRVFRIAGKGAAKLKGGKSGSLGDLKAKVSVVVPEALTDRQKELFEELAAETNDDIRADLNRLV